jgi:hypothetical protein
MTAPVVVPFLESTCGPIILAFARRGRLHWYDLILMPLAAVAIFPDKFLDWVGARTGWCFESWHLLIVEAVVVAALVVATALLMPSNPGLHWWYPFVLIAVVGIARVLMHLVERLCGFGD